MRTTTTICFFSLFLGIITPVTITTPTLSSLSFQNSLSNNITGSTSNGNGFLCDKDSGECLLLLDGQTTLSQTYEWKTTSSYSGNIDPLDSMDCWASDHTNTSITKCIFTSSSKFFILSINAANQASLSSQINIPLPASPNNQPFQFVEVKGIEFTNFVYAVPDKNFWMILMRLDISDNSYQLIQTSSWNRLSISTAKLYPNRHTPYL